MYVKLDLDVKDENHLLWASWTAVGMLIPTHPSTGHFDNSCYTYRKGYDARTGLGSMWQTQSTVFAQEHVVRCLWSASRS